MYPEHLMEHFFFQGRQAIVVRPEVPVIGRLVLKTEYFTDFPGFEEAMLTKGYHVAFLTHQTHWAPKEEIDLTAAFIRFVTDKYGLAPRCVPVGLSCGGLYAAKLAEAYPELIAALYLDAPVLNILSMLGMGEAAFNEMIYRELADTYGFSRSTAVNFRQSPIDNMQPLIDHQIPVFMVYGNADSLVIYGENGRVLEDFYRKNNGNIQVVCKSMCAHHPHGLSDPSPIVDFVERFGLWHTKETAWPGA